ncbi:MAG: DUF2723 domain-containing protein [Chloroflexota bacterium]
MASQNTQHATEQSLPGERFSLLAFRFPLSAPRFTLPAPRSPLSAFRSTLHALRTRPDALIGLLLFLAGLYVYTSTLAPTVLEGDAALFQYTPYVLGVTYPTGYPLYILLGKLWVTLLPVGEIAWRMNLLSALCSAAALPLIYATARQLLDPNLGRAGAPAPGVRAAALAAALAFATLPPWWRWSTEAKIYAMNILLFSGLLYTLACALATKIAVAPKSNNLLSPSSSSPPPLRFPLSASRSPLPAPRSPLSAPRSPLSARRLILASAFLWGLQISVHSTTVLLAPGLLLLAWLYLRREVFSPRSFFIHIALLAIPGLLYFYIPLRGEGLIAAYGRPDAVRHGLLADFYHSGWAGWVRYFTAADFTGGVVANWGLVPAQFVTVYVAKLLPDTVTWPGVIVGLVGGLGLLIRRPRLFWPLFLLYAGPIPFVLTYGQGEQDAFLLPSFLIFSLFLGNSLLFGQWLLAKGIVPLLAPRFTLYALRLTPLLLLLGLIPLLVLPQTRYNLNRLDAKWSRAIYDEWADALAHPLEPGAAMLAHWGDLTSFWYMQHAEGRRPDLLGLYPPTEEVVAAYLNDGGDLYIAGPLQGWAAGIEERYRLIPWGRLVRLAPRQVDPQTLLPSLGRPGEAVFDQKLRLLGAEFAPQASGGRDYEVTLAWQALADLPPETTISLRLSQGNSIVAQLDDTLLSGWFPRDSLPTGQYVLSYARLPVPLGTLPGPYRLQLVAYTSYKQPWSLADGRTLLDLGEVELISPLDRRPEAGWLAATFGHELVLADAGYTVTRVGQGKGFGIRLLWWAKNHPEDNYTLLAELVDANGRTLRSMEVQPVGGRAPTGGWQAGQFVQDQVDLVLPASAPVGDNAIRVQLSWRRGDGSKLAVRRGLLPLGDNLKLDWLTVTEKEDRVFEVPALQYSDEANFENKVRFLGYNSPALAKAQTGLIRFDPAGCAVPCPLHFDFYWQGVSEMDRLYSVFLHAVDEQGRIVGQHDRGPGIRAKQPTTSWLPGEVVLDPVDLALPTSLPPGRYTLRLGMYLPPAPRLLILDEQGQPAADFMEVGTIEVR